MLQLTSSLHIVSCQLQSFLSLSFMPVAIPFLIHSEAALVLKTYIHSPSHAPLVVLPVAVIMATELISGGKLQATIIKHETITVDGIESINVGNTSHLLSSFPRLFRSAGHAVFTQSSF